VFLGSVWAGEEDGGGGDGRGENEGPEEHSVAHQSHLLPLAANALAALALLHASLVPLDGGVNFVQRPQELPFQAVCNPKMRFPYSQFRLQTRARNYTEFHATIKLKANERAKVVVLYLGLRLCALRMKKCFLGWFREKFT
jgi:hypothetical protein